MLEKGMVEEGRGIRNPQQAPFSGAGGDKLMSAPHIYLAPGAFSEMGEAHTHLATKIAPFHIFS